MNKMVSIIIPTYNQENYIAETLECVIKQTYKDWECIIVDDGSTDNTCNIVKKYLNEKIKYIKQKQSGVCEARNNGIRNTSGEYILFLDSDDKISDNFLEEAVKCISEDENIKVIAPYINKKASIATTTPILANKLGTNKPNNETNNTKTIAPIDIAYANFLKKLPCLNTPVA